MIKLKSVHVTNYYHGSSGGVRAFYNALLNYGNSRRRFVRLIVPGSESGYEDVGEFGRIYTIKAPIFPLIDRRYRLLLPIGRNGHELHRILRAERPDILEVSDKYSMPFLSGMVRKGWIRGVNRPTEIATSHERMDDNVCTHLLGGIAGQFLAATYMRFIYFPMFDHHIANSDYTASELVPASVGHTTRRGIWVCPMGLNVASFPFLPRPQSENIKQLLYAGRLAPEKNVDVLPSMLERLPLSFTLTIAGDGPRRQWLEAEMARLAPGRAEFIGHVRDRDHFSKVVARSDVFVHPNPREPFGISLLEAMASGLPVVAPRSGGVLSYASDENAWLCGSDADELAAGVLRVFTSGDKRMTRVRNARRTAEKYDWKEIASRYFGLIDGLHHRGFQIDEPPLGAAIDEWSAMRLERLQTGVEKASTTAV